MSFLTMKYNLKLSKEESLLLKFLCHISKNIYNSSIYELRQQFFNKKEYLSSYFELNGIMKQNENFHILNTYMSICTIRNAHTNMMKFKRGKGDLPKYLDKKGYYPLITDQIRIISDKDKKYIKLPLSNIVRTGKIFKEEFLDKTIKDYLKMFIL